MKSIFQHHTSTGDLSFIVKEYRQHHFTSPYHFHDCYELILIVKSFGKLYAGNKVLNFEDGDMFLFGPEFAHCFYNDPAFANSGETAHAIVIFFREDFLGKDFLQKPELSKIKTLLEKSKTGIKFKQPTVQHKSSFKTIVREKEMPALLHLLQLLHTFSLHKNKDLLCIDSGTRKIINDYEDADKLDAVFKYVLENFKDGVSSKKAASLAFMNEAAFCRYFKRRTEKTFSQFVNYVRITHATQLLMSKDWSIVNICFECGYSNVSYFNREFKTIMGMTPLVYRKSFEHLKVSEKKGEFEIQ